MLKNNMIQKFYFSQVLNLLQFLNHVIYPREQSHSCYIILIVAMNSGKIS